MDDDVLRMIESSLELILIDDRPGFVGMLVLALNRKSVANSSAFWYIRNEKQTLVFVLSRFEIFFFFLHPVGEHTAAALIFTKCPTSLQLTTISTRDRGKYFR